VETEVLRMGYYIYGWRHVPVDISCLGEKANATRPEIEQILIANAKGVDEETFERELYVIRRRIEKAGGGIRDFYICSLSCRSIIYKGMMLAEQVAVFYPDLMDPRFESAFAIYHQRYSTNTFPRWWLAQPFRMLAHNGEINTLKGNLNWLKSHEIRMASAISASSPRTSSRSCRPARPIRRRSTASSRCWCGRGARRRWRRRC
jgi:glutamate synthase (NADPH) large chain